ncbi:MAG: DegT/DnrJ/EryC1/StrS family aminotransferase [Candidatus Obscuribacterales bacterium]
MPVSPPCPSQEEGLRRVRYQYVGRLISRFLVDHGVDCRGVRKIVRQFCRHETRTALQFRLISKPSGAFSAYLGKTEERQLRPGDEVVTMAADFRLPVNPIVQNNLVPVFVDIELGTYDPLPERLAEAIGPKTRPCDRPHARKSLQHKKPCKPWPQRA